jgi:hypothetical protein
VDSGGLDASATLSSIAVGTMVSQSDKVDEAGVLAPLYGEKLCDLLVSLEAASPGYSMELLASL